MCNAKKLVIKTIYILINLLFSFSLFSQTIKIPERFKEAKIPELETKEWLVLNSPEKSYAVSIKDNVLEITQNKSSERKEFATKTGRVIGYDEGEFGGSLNFVAYSSPKILRIKIGNIVDIFDFNGKIYFLEDYIYGNKYEGALSELIINNNNFQIQKLVNFDDAPLTAIQVNGKIYVASRHSFYVVEENYPKKIFEKQFWWYLFPNSIAIYDDENIFMGIRGGIVKLDIKNNTVKLYKETE